MSVTRSSAGLLLYRRRPAEQGAGSAPEVLIGHMGGPFWARKTTGAWSIPKGEIEAGEEPLQAALREFEEETGLPLPIEAHALVVDLGSVRQGSSKTVRVWALDHDIDETAAVPGTFEMEWPPRSGSMRSFPEMDRFAWCALDTAADLLVPAQRAFLDRLPHA